MDKQHKFLCQKQCIFPIFLRGNGNELTQNGNRAMVEMNMFIK